MAQMPVTVLPREEGKLSGILTKGIKGIAAGQAIGLKAREKGEEKQKELIKAGYTQKKNAVDMLIKTVGPKLTPENRAKLWENKDTAESVSDVYGEDVLASLKASAGTPIQPSWAQTQKIASIKSGIKEGFYSVATLLGEPEAVPINTRQDALKIIYDADLSPDWFSEELSSLPAVPAEKKDEGGAFRRFLERGKTKDKGVKADATAVGGQGKLRAQATQILKDKGYPVDEANIKALIQQLSKGTK